MDRIAEQHPEDQAPRRRRAGRGIVAAGAAVVALGIGAVGASAGSPSSDAAQDTGAVTPGFVQETTPERPADPTPRDGKPCPEDGSGSRGQDGAGSDAQTPDASDAAVY
jgi:hypothetical protein